MKLGLVMIVKDGAQTLEAGLKSVQEIVDEYFIFDTGSTDGTQEIIARYAKLRHLPFSNFVETKNVAISLATTDYILFMDADEYLLSGAGKLRELAEQGAEAVACRIVEAGLTYTRVRLWKNDGSWKFRGPYVHEVILNDEDRQAVFCSEAAVYHDHQFRSPESYAARNALYVRLLTEYLSEHPNDARALFYLGRTYSDAGDPIEAIAAYKQFLEVGLWSEEIWEAWYGMAEAYKALGQYDQAFAALKQCASTDPERGEAYFLAGVLYHNLNLYQECLDNMSKALSMPVPERALFVQPLKYRALPLDYISICAAMLKDYASAAAAMEDYRTVARPDERIVNNLIWFRKQARHKLFFCLGHTPEAVIPGMLDKQGAGGVETAYIELTRRLAEDHEVFLFCDCLEEAVYENVRYIPTHKLADYLHLRPDTAVTSRWYDEEVFEAEKTVIWLQDAWYAPAPLKKASAVVCSSPWHRMFIAERTNGYDVNGKLRVLPLGIDKSAFPEPDKRAGQVIYSSNPDRGLFELQEMWAEITDRCPGIHLTVTYGWEGLQTWSGDPAYQERVQKQKAALEAWAEQAGNVRFTGRLKKSALYREMASSVLCLYPNNFWETFCLTALETQMSATPMVATDMGALSTTLKRECNVLVPGHPKEKGYRKAFIQAAVDLYNDPERLKQMAEGGRQFVQGSPLDWGDVARAWYVEVLRR